MMRRRIWRPILKPGRREARSLVKTVLRNRVQDYAARHSYKAQLHLAVWYGMWEIQPLSPEK